MKTFTLPRPISTNNLFVNGAKGKGRFPSEEYKSWKELAGYMLNTQDTTPIPSPYAVEIRLPKTWRGDVDNASKAYLDILEARGVLDNDKNVNRLTISRENQPEATVTVMSEAAA